MVFSYTSLIKIGFYQIVIPRMSSLWSNKVCVIQGTRPLGAFCHNYWIAVVYLFFLLNSIPSVENNDDPDQLASGEASWSGSTLFFIHTKIHICFLQTYIILNICRLIYSKTCLKRLLKERPKIGFQDRLSLNAGQKYCRMHQGEHSAKLLTFIKLHFVLKIFVLSIFGWPLKADFTVYYVPFLFLTQYIFYATLCF